MVVHHDEDFSRMTSGLSSGLVHQTHYEDFPKLQPPSTQNERLSEPVFDGHTDHSHDTLYKTIPLLEQVISLLPLTVTVIIEFKQNSDELIEKVHAIVLACSKRCDSTGLTRKDNLLWFSLQEPINVKLRKFDPSIPTIASVPKLLKTLALYYSGLLPFCSLDFDAMGIPVDEVSEGGKNSFAIFMLKWPLIPELFVSHNIISCLVLVLVLLISSILRFILILLCF